jgi:hypothetical protein
MKTSFLNNPSKSNSGMKKGINRQGKRKYATKKKKALFTAIIMPELIAKKTLPTKNLIRLKH